MSTRLIAPNPIPNEKRIALRMGWSAAELVAYMTSVILRRSHKLSRNVGTIHSDQTTDSPPLSPTEVPSTGDSVPAFTPPRYKVGRNLTIAERKEDQKTGLSDSKKLWFLGRTVVRLSQELSISPKELLEPILHELTEFPREPSEGKWRTLFHCIESWNNEAMVELAARDPLSAQAFRTGKQLAQLTRLLPAPKEVRQRVDEDGYIDAYTLLQGLEISEIATLISDLRELRGFLPDGTFSAIASGLSAWEIKGMLIRHGNRLMLRPRPRLPGLRYTLVGLPIIHRLVDTRFFRWLRPRFPRHSNPRLSLAKATMISTNWRKQCAIWRGLVFETNGPPRLLRASDWFRIHFLSNVALFLAAVSVAAALAGLGLAIAFFAVPGIVDLASIAYAHQQFELSKLVQALSLGPLLTFAGAIVARIRNLAAATGGIKQSTRSRLIARAIRKQAVCQWNQRH